MRGFKSFTESTDQPNRQYYASHVTRHEDPTVPNTGPDALTSSRNDAGQASEWHQRLTDAGFMHLHSTHVRQLDPDSELGDHYRSIRPLDRHVHEYVGDRSMVDALHKQPGLVYASVQLHDGDRYRLNAPVQHSSLLVRPK